MNLQHLCSTSHVQVYFDSWNNWLYVDWEGELTLDIVQRACLEIARCFLRHAYPRVLNNNAQVTGISRDVPAWLACEFLPYLTVVGVEQMAWVCSPSVRGRDVAIETLSRLPQTTIALFDDVEQAVTWMQHTRPAYTNSVPAQQLVTPAPASAMSPFTRQLRRPLEAVMLPG